MHVFVTGGTGTIGSAVVAELLAHGHTVLALARSDASERTLRDAGAEVLRGEIADLDVLRSGAAQSDGVVNLAFGRDYGTPEALARSIREEGAAKSAFRGEEAAGAPIQVSDLEVTAAMAAVRPKTFLQATYRALREHGKVPMVALGAIMRKLLTLMRAILIGEIPFEAGGKPRGKQPA